MGLKGPTFKGSHANIRTRSLIVDMLNLSSHILTFMFQTVAGPTVRVICSPLSRTSAVPNACLTRKSRLSDSINFCCGCCCCSSINSQFLASIALCACDCIFQASPRYSPVLAILDTRITNIIRCIITRRNADNLTNFL